MDETALYWARGPNKTLNTERVSGQKLFKDRITLALCANADGSGKLKLLIINKSKSPRAFTTHGRSWDVNSHVHWEWNRMVQYLRNMSQD